MTTFEVAEQGAVADFHLVAVQDAQCTAVLVIVEGGLAVLQATVFKSRKAGVLKTDSVPAAATEVEKMESRGVGHGEGDGVGFGAEGHDGSPFFGLDAVISVEEHRRPRKDAQGILNGDISGNENRVGFPNA